MVKYKAKITKENFKTFADYYNADKGRAKSLLKSVDEVFYRCDDPAKDNAHRMFNAHWMGDSRTKYTFNLGDGENQQLKILVDYTADHGLAWDVVKMEGDFLYLCFSGRCMFWTKEFCELIELPDYEAMTMAEMRGQIGTSAVGSMLPAEMNGLSIASVNEEKNAIHDKEEKLKKLKDDIEYAKTEELKKLNDEIRKLQDKLRERKKELLSELNEKMSAMQAEMDKLNNKIYMMESEIYVIRSYSGETVELNKARNGRKADAETPLVVNQKLIYLDEDLARIVSIYQGEIADQYSLFSDAVAGSDEVFDSFCPQERCLTFFRLSNNATYSWYNADRHMYENEELIHGKKMGFILRDGECAYVGYLDESWRRDKDGEPVPVTFTGNLMYKPGEKQEYQVKEDGFDKETHDSRNTMLSRAFAMSVVQGILDNRGLLEFPEKVSVTKPGKYIVYNFADGWIMDDRFGDFATLVDNLNKRTKVGDTILVCYNKRYCEGRGEADRAHDCEVPEGLNRVNFIEATDEYGHCNVYVSAKKRYSSCGATANVRCRENEYINITYMNSIWLTYYVQTKKLGSYCNDYAKMIKHFKRAIEIIRERETEEMAYIKKYYPDADQIPEWQVLLSHWKLNNHIRVINDFQAKRVAKYLESGKYEENAHLFDKEEFYNMNATFGGKYAYTQFSFRFSSGKSNPDGFDENSDYYRQNFYLRNYDDTNRFFDSEDAKKEREEHNAVVLAKELPALEALVPGRVEKDEEKLMLINTAVMDFMAEHGVKVSDLTDESRRTTLILDNDENCIAFIPVDELDKGEKDWFFAEADGNYPEYVLKSECWKVAYNDFVQRQYDVVLHDVKMILHRRHMDARRG